MIQKQYVVVNLSRQANGVHGGHPIMPGDDPQAFFDLDEAVECLAYLRAEYGHDEKSAYVFDLVPVLREVLELRVTAAQQRLAAEQAEGGRGTMALTLAREE